MPFQFYETIIVDEESRIPVHLLTAGRDTAEHVLTVDIGWNADLRRFEDPAEEAFPALHGLLIRRARRQRLPAEAWQVETFTEYLWREPVVPLEGSPVSGRTLASLAGAASPAASGILLAEGTARLVLVGIGFGIVVLSPIARAAWEGARPEIVSFSGDWAAFKLDAIRARLGIPRRGQPPDSD